MMQSHDILFAIYLAANMKDSPFNSRAFAQAGMLRHMFFYNKTLEFFADWCIIAPDKTYYEGTYETGTANTSFYK